MDTAYPGMHCQQPRWIWLVAWSIFVSALSGCYHLGEIVSSTTTTYVGYYNSFNIDELVYRVGTKNVPT